MKVRNWKEIYERELVEKCIEVEEEVKIEKSAEERHYPNVSHIRVQAIYTLATGTNG